MAWCRRHQDWRQQQVLSNLLKCALTLIIPNSRLTLPQESENGLTDVYQSSDESADVLKSTQEASDLSLCPRCRHVKDDSNFIWICLYASLIDHVSQELPINHSESALLGIQFQYELPDSLKESPQIC